MCACASSPAPLCWQLVYSPAHKVFAIFDLNQPKCDTRADWMLLSVFYWQLRQTETFEAVDWCIGNLGSSPRQSFVDFLQPTLAQPPAEKTVRCRILDVRTIGLDGLSGVCMSVRSSSTAILCSRDRLMEFWE